MRRLLIVLGLILALPHTVWAAEGSDGVFEVRLENQEVVLPAGYRGLNCFPDEPIAFLRQRPPAFLMTAGNVTYLMTGRSLRAAVPIAKMLTPGASGSFDNGYAGAGSVYYDQEREEWLVFYHAEDHEGMPMVSYNKTIHGAYWSVGLATAKRSSKQLAKIGQILSASVKKSEVTSEHQGIGDVCVIPDATQSYLYAYFTDITRRKGLFTSNTKIGMARCKIEDGGRPGKWMKYYQGDFNEPGLGGLEGSVVFPPLLNSDVFAPHVTYVPALKAYLMVCNVMVYSDHLKPRAQAGGIYYCYSKDGIRWSVPAKLVVGHPIPYLNLEYIGHPHLVLNRESEEGASGLLLYCYSPRWGTTASQMGHCLASRPITFTRVNAGDPLPEPSKSAWELLMSLRPRLRSSKFNNKGELVAGDLTGVPLSHDEVRAVSTIRSLERAMLAQTGINDEDIQKLAVLPGLRLLDLSETNVTDEAVGSLTKLHSLEQLDVHGTKMSADGVGRLKEALPRCEVKF